MNEKLIAFLEEIRKQMANRSVTFMSVSRHGDCMLDAVIRPLNSLDKTIDTALNTHVINEDLYEDFIDCCCDTDPMISFYVDCDTATEKFYIKYSYSDHESHFIGGDGDGVILTPEEGLIDPKELSDRILNTIYDSFRTMYVCDGIILDIPDPHYCLYDNGTDITSIKENLGKFANFVTDALMYFGYRG